MNLKLAGSRKGSAKDYTGKLVISGSGRQLPRFILQGADLQSRLQGRLYRGSSSQRTALLIKISPPQNCSLLNGLQAPLIPQVS